MLSEARGEKKAADGSENDCDELAWGRANNTSDANPPAARSAKVQASDVMRRGVHGEYEATPNVLFGVPS